MKIVVIMPTYNESDNVKAMIDTLAGGVFPKIKKHQMHLLFVDDYSPDGTGEIVKKELKKHKNIYLLQKKREGLGSAYRKGFIFAINRLSADAVIEMDADFQHDPKDVVRLVNTFDAGYDYVLGSRFTEGGSIPKDWGLKRIILSVGGNYFIRTLLGIWSVKDLTTGFRLTRVKGVLDKINFKKLFSDSYAYKIHLLYEIIHQGAKVKEIPIKFVSRNKGWSKMDFADFLESLKVVFKIFINNLCTKIVGFVTNAS